MSRQARRLAESKTYHVMIRGNEQKDIFLDNEDRKMFLDVLYWKSRDNNFSIYAYCLMSNHVHLLINEGENSISRIMKRINISYAAYFNRKYQRVGHLFQDRFRSEAIENERYLLAAVRYIHNNPVKAGINKKPWEYQWSSCQPYLHSEQDRFLNTSFILNLFADNVNRARKLFLEFSSTEGKEVFIDCVDGPSYDKKVINDENGAIQFIADFLKKKRLSTIENRQVRNELIKELKEKSSLSIRTIAGILEIDRNIVQKAK